MMYSRAAIPAPPRCFAISSVLLIVSLGMPLQASANDAARAKTSSVASNTAPGGDASSSKTRHVDPVTGYAYETVHGYAIAESDIIIGKADSSGKLESRLQFRGLGRYEKLDRWHDGIVPYQFSDELTATQRSIATEAIEHWNTHTRMSMIERTANNENEYTDYLLFEPSDGCASWVGRIGGEQAIWVADRCSAGSVIHEIGHAVGLYHEHTRPDRDDFITVQWDNIVENRRFNFDIVGAPGADGQPGEAVELGDYDYASIMHYGNFFWSTNGEATILVPDGELIGQRVALSAGDAEAANMMYATDLSVSSNAVTNGDIIEYDIAVSNLGNLGAHQLELTADISESADWLQISSGSGWDCRAFGAELRCTRPRLKEENISRFTITVNPAGAPAEDLELNLASRTLDTDLSNNRVSNKIDDEPVDGQTTQPEPSPEPGAAQPTMDEKTPTSGGDTPGGIPAQPTTVADNSAAGGALHPLLALVLLPYLASRRRRRPSSLPA